MYVIKLIYANTTYSFISLNLFAAHPWGYSGWLATVDGKTINNANKTMVNNETIKINNETTAIGIKRWVRTEQDLQRGKWDL